MKCKICNQATRDLKDGMCFDCYRHDQAIRFEPEALDSSSLLTIPNASSDFKHKHFRLHPSVFDITIDDGDGRPSV